MTCAKRTGGFTLVEILIVVVILGILAAIVIPQFTNAAEEANATTAASQLSTLRIQFELYKLHHNDNYPGLDQFWANMLSKTDAQGNIDENGEFGPYLRRPPSNPFTHASSVVAPGSETANDGWTYEASTGHIEAVGFDEQTGAYTAPE